MKPFKHVVTQEARSRGGKSGKRKKNDPAKEEQQRLNMEAIIDRCRAGRPQKRDKQSLQRYHMNEVKYGSFEGTFEEWLIAHDCPMPPTYRQMVKILASQPQDMPDEGGIICQQLADITVKYAGPEVLWGLMVIAGQLPLIPRPRSTSSRIFA